MATMDVWASAMKDEKEDEIFCLGGTSRKKQKEFKKVWMDGSFDILHAGHIEIVKQAKALCESLTIGIQSDEDVRKHKGPPVYPEEERYKLIAALKYTDETIKSAPYGTTVEILDKYECDVCVHGADTTLLTNPDDVLNTLARQNRLRLTNRKHGMSTTQLIQRILKWTADDEKSNNKANLKDLQTAGSSLYLTALKISQLSSGIPPTPRSKIVYVAGAFDLFHVGHLAFLEKAAAQGDYLIVGLHTDQVVEWYNGSVPLIQSLTERFEMVLAFRCVSDVVLGTPYTVTATMMDCLKIDLVCHGKTEIKLNDDSTDPYAEPKSQNRFLVIDSGSDVTSQLIIERITNRREEFETRNRIKEKKEREAQEKFKTS